jgi:hypothetical protein
MTNSTLSGNAATDRGGGILNSNSGIIAMTNNTLSGNAAGGVNGGGGIINYGTLSLSNNIIANSPSGGDCANFSASLVDNGHNLVEDNGCSISGGSDPLLGPLQDNGGPTFTHALMLGSPAINAGDTSLTTDQRAVARPANGSDDIGAFELVFNSIFLPSITR